MDQNLIIRPDSPDAATYRTNIKGWVSRHGRFYGDNPDSERIARWDGATVGSCETCGADCTKHWLACDRCRALNEIENYWAMPSKPHEEGMVYSQARDEYYHSIDDALEAVADDDEEEGEKATDAERIASLRLMLCKQVCARELDVDFFADDLPTEDWDLPKKLSDAIDAFNEAVKDVVLSWQTTKYRLSLSSVADIPGSNPLEGPEHENAAAAEPEVTRVRPANSPPGGGEADGREVARPDPA